MSNCCVVITFSEFVCFSSLQEFLLNMEDSVDETESVKRYNQYKLDFRRQQLQDFFLQHKDQEWFRSKYHPDDIKAKKAESLGALKTRLGVFLFLLDNNWFDNVSLDMEHAPAIIKLLDAGKERGFEPGTFFNLFILKRMNIKPKTKVICASNPSQLQRSHRCDGNFLCLLFTV